MDFKYDFVEIASEILRKEGVTIPTEWNSRDICINFFELTYRWFDSSIPYHVVYSQELLAKISSLTDDEQNAIKNIEKCLNNCEKITQYMSRGIKNTEIEKSDFLLKNWGIYHLHLEELRPPIRKYTKPNLLFFQVKGNVVHFIDVRRHPKGSEWFTRELLEIIYKNWPNLLVFLNGIKPSQEIPDNQVHNLTKQINVIVDFHGGALAPSNFGVMSSGHSYMSVQKSIKIINNLEKYELELKKREDEIKQAILNSTRKKISEKLDYKLIFEDDCFFAQEIHSKEAIKLFQI